MVEEKSVDLSSYIGLIGDFRKLGKGNGCHCDLIEMIFCLRSVCAYSRNNERHHIYINVSFLSES